MQRSRVFVATAAAVVAGLLAAAPALSADSADRHEIRLVLQITVDGFRRDLLDRYAARFGQGGFEYLLDSWP